MVCLVRDSGFLHELLGNADRRHLELHPKVGASCEGFAVEEVLKSLYPDEAYYWATYQGTEIDLVAGSTACGLPPQSSLCTG